MKGVAFGGTQTAMDRTSTKLPPLPGRRDNSAAARARVRRHKSLTVAVVVFALMAVISLALEFGYDEPPLPIGVLVAVQTSAIVVYAVSRGYTIITSGKRWRALRACWADGLLLLGVVFLLAVGSDRVATPALKVSASYVAAMQILLVSRLLIAAARLNLMLSRSRLHPARSLAITFIILIVLGGLALSLPKATHPRARAHAASVPQHILNSFFTATSATCVTGLVVYDTGNDYTLFGQIVILVLIQAGGLGIMIFGSVLGLLVGRQLSLRQSLVLQDALSHRTLGQMRTLIVFIVVFTFAAEAIGALVLYSMWDGSLPPGQRVYQSVFHAVSAFCNAGFALPSDSMVTFNRSWQVYGSIMPLIIVGGLGFPVLSDLQRAILAGIRRRLAQRRGIALTSTALTPYRFTLHTKLVLVTTAWLIVLPTLGFLLLEPAGPSASAPGRFLDALFLSVTCRTAGFNTVLMDSESLSPGTHFLSGILMFIGGSPASTAGGIKTVGLAVLLLGVWSTLRGRRNVEAFGRTIPDIVVRRAAVVTVLMFATVALSTVVLCYTESTSLREAWFESVSACGTVGLSTGLTPDLTVTGRLVIMIAMFAGRLGPLTVLIALAGSTRTSCYDFPTEHVGIG